MSAEGPLARLQRISEEIRVRLDEDLARAADLEQRLAAAHEAMRADPGHETAVDTFAIAHDLSGIDEGFGDALRALRPGVTLFKPEREAKAA